ncbi:MAG: hypothetical protein CBC48_11845 [bacterium TMED88]|nr:MAG: hypothetical protein CBC48_11845 [bacterium TMED88]
MDHLKLYTSVMSVLEAYEVMVSTNEEMLILYDVWFPFIKPRVSFLHMSNSDLEMRQQVLSNKEICLAYNLLEIENNFIVAQRIYEEHLKYLTNKKLKIHFF